jgi:hypothetical protein
MKKLIVNGALVLHRAIFTASAALLGVGGSLLAEDASSVSNWGLVLGPTLLMYVEDLCGTIETNAQKLAPTSPNPLADVRVELFDLKRPVLLFTLLAVGAGALVGGLALRVLENNSSSETTHNQTSPAAQKSSPPKVVCIRARGKSVRLACSADGRTVPVTVRRK